MKKTIFIISLIFIFFQSFSQKDEKVISKTVNTKPEAFPVNFVSKDLKKLKNWNNKIIAFDGEILRIEKNIRNAPYYEVQIGDNTIWVVSMIDSGFGKIGNNVRFVGYVQEIHGAFERQYHDMSYHVIVFGVLDLDTNKLAYFSSSEGQVKVWMNGQVPVSEMSDDE